MKFALIQFGYAILGVGDSPEAARADAIANNGDENGRLADAVVRRNMAAVRFNHVDGDLVIVPCTDGLAAAVVVDADVCWEENPHGICLESEL